MDNLDPFLLHNSAKCLNCGNVLVSTHRHDFKTCFCGELSVDGGLDYSKRSYKAREQILDLSIYSDAEHDNCRQYITRGGYGKDMKGEYRQTTLDKISDAWLANLIPYVEAQELSTGMQNKYLPFYKKEVEYRKLHNITIGEQDE